MFNSFWVSAFPEVFGDAIIIDSVAYIPFDSAIDTISSFVVAYAILFCAAFWFARQLIDLVLTLFEMIYKSIRECNNPPAAEG